jgi:hypothetical protein
MEIDSVEDKVNFAVRGGNERKKAGEVGAGGGKSIFLPPENSQ